MSWTKLSPIRLVSGIRSFWTKIVHRTITSLDWSENITLDFQLVLNYTSETRIHRLGGHMKVHVNITNEDGEVLYIIVINAVQDPVKLSSKIVEALEERFDVEQVK